MIVARLPRAIRKAYFSAVQSCGTKYQGRENAVDVRERASADKRKRAARCRGKFREQPLKGGICGDIFRARLNFEQRSINIEEKGARLTRRALCQITRLQRNGEASQNRYQAPVLGIDAQGSLFGNASPFCKSSIEILSGERINAICPSRGGRLMVTPDFISLSHRA